MVNPMGDWWRETDSKFNGNPYFVQLLLRRKRNLEWELRLLNQILKQYSKENKLHIDLNNCKIIEDQK